jgi:hypothetical protein
VACFELYHRIRVARLGETTGWSVKTQIPTEYFQYASHPRYNCAKITFQSISKMSTHLLTAISSHCHINKLVYLNVVSLCDRSTVADKDGW